jgi:DNA repair protein RecN (Recombination protein N)
VVAELEPLGLAAGEDAELESECARLRHAAALAGAAGALADACGGTDDAQGAADLIAAAVDVARGVGDIDRALDALAAEAAESVARLRELALEGRRLGADMVVDEARLGAVEERLDVLDRVRRRHGGSLEAALGVLHLAAERVTAATASGSADTAVALAAAARVEASARCTELSRRRVRAGAELEAAVHDRLRSLGLRHARFRAVVRQRDDADGLEFEGRRVACGTDGIDEVEFRLAADRNGVPLPLSQGSSGGELSRLALALRAVAADRDECPTLVLDEVDAGVGGETAARVGELIAAIGAGRQVIAVTHRAEIAARASAHIVVTKREVRHRATAGAARVEGVARVGEVARLLSGRTTPAALTRAAELLEEGDPGIASAPRTIAPG